MLRWTIPLWTGLLVACGASSQPSDTPRSEAGVDEQEGGFAGDSETAAGKTDEPIDEDDVPDVPPAD